MIVSPGREDEGLMHMPTGQSGHPLSPFYAASHEAWLNGDATPDMDLLAAEFLDPDGENQIAISADRQRAIPRFVRQSLAELPAQVPKVRGDATYLVTGGLGMLGRSVAKWLIAKGAKHLVLAGRSASAADHQLERRDVGRPSGPVVLLG